MISCWYGILFKALNKGAVCSRFFLFEIIGMVFFCTLQIFLMFALLAQLFMKGQ
jgi:hypothetical protein